MNAKGVQGAVKASFKQALKASDRVAILLEDIKDGGDFKKLMPELRDRLADLNKGIHEFNAYHNVATT